MKILESAENYLETILILKKKLGKVRSIDIANQLKYSKPSISSAMKQFREHGYITMTEEGFISLTPKGLQIARRIYERHRLLTEFLIELGVSEDTAKEDACRIEHHISTESFNKIKAHLKQLLKYEANNEETMEDDIDDDYSSTDNSLSPCVACGSEDY